MSGVIIVLISGVHSDKLSTVKCGAGISDSFPVRLGCVLIFTLYCASVNIMLDSFTSLVSVIQTNSGFVREVPVCLSCQIVHVGSFYPRWFNRLALRGRRGTSVLYTVSVDITACRIISHPTNKEHTQSLSLWLRIQLREK